MKYDLKKQLRSFGYAWKGIQSCVGKEQNLSFHLIAAMAVIIAGIVLGIITYRMDNGCDVYRDGYRSRTVQYRH